jgi:DNA-binding LytR/AlgR family response regulator
MKIKCIAIDDEPLALELIEAHVKKIPYLQFCGAFDNPIKALSVLKNDEIDLIYLDINMPDLSGIDFLKGIQNPPLVIFITAYEQFAIQGFELQATDYLLKPVSFNRFLLAADRALELLKLKGKPAAGKPTDFMFVKSEHNILKISFNDIHYIEGFKDYVKIFTNETKPVLTINTFKSLEELLPENLFIRIHKSYVIAIDKIKSFRNGKVLVKDKHIPIGDSYREVFNKKIVSGRL